MQIAKRCDSKQVMRDVDVAKFFFYNMAGSDRNYQYARRIDMDAFIVGYFSTKGFHIIGIGVVKEKQGNGLAGQLIRALFEDCRRVGCHKVTTRTTSGTEFYKHYGFKVTGIAPNWSKHQIDGNFENYTMEKRI